MGEAAYRVRFGGVSGNARGVERGDRRVVLAQPHRKHRFIALVAVALVQRAGQRLGRIGRRSEGGGHVDHQQRVVFRVVEQGFDRRGIARAISVDNDVDRVAARPAFRQRLIELFQRLGRQPGQGAAAQHQLIHRQLPHPATIAQDGQAPAGETAEPAQRFGSGEQLVQRAHAQQAGTCERRAVHRIRTGQRLRVGIRIRVDAELAAGLDHHHRFGARGGACGRHEFARIADAFDVEQDRAGAIVGSEIIEQIAEVHIQRVAQRHHCRKPHRARHAPLHQRGGNGAGFGNQRQIAGLRAMRGDAGIEPRMRGDHAQAVRAEDAHAFGTCGRFHARSRRTGATP